MTDVGAAPVSAPAQPEPIGWPIWRLAWVIVFGAFASGLDASLANIGLDAIGTDLHAGLSATQWIASGYLLALAVSLPLAGWLGRRVGVGRLWLAALVGFTIASGLCAAAPTIESLIGLRIVQGVAGGLLIPAGQTVLGQAVGAERLGRVMATLGIAVTVAPALGPVVGGLILHAGSWRWLFAINLPIGVIGALLGLRYLPRGRPGATAGPDWPGLVLISTGLPLLVYALTEWGHRGSVGHAGVLGPLIAGTVTLGAFVARSRARAGAVLDLALYRNRVFRAASVASGFTGMLLFGSGLVFPLYFLLGRHASVVGTGLHLLGLGGATAAALPVSGRLVDRYGGGPPATIGTTLAVLTTIGFALLPLDANPVLVHANLAVLGAAIALGAVPPGIAAYKSVRADQLADATTAVNIAQRVGGALGAALFTVILAGALPADINTGFHRAFWAMAAAAAVASASALWLWRCSRQREPGPPR